MTKYTSNEQYEMDKAKFIANILRFSEIQKLLHGTREHQEAEDLADLLKQSKWIGAVDGDVYAKGHRAGSTIITDNQPCTLLKDVDTTTTIPK